jgi:flagellar hook-basal body complex protein FliE
MSKTLLDTIRESRQEQLTEQSTVFARIEQLIRMGMMPINQLPHLKRAMIQMESGNFMPTHERNAFYTFVNSLMELTMTDPAILRQMKNRVANKAGMKESVNGDESQQLQELSKATLKSYVKGAVDDAKAMSAVTSRHSERAHLAKEAGNIHDASAHRKQANRAFDKGWKRRNKILQAVDKLSEETLQEGGNAENKAKKNEVVRTSIEKEWADSNDSHLNRARGQGPHSNTGDSLVDRFPWMTKSLHTSHREAIAKMHKKEGKKIDIKNVLKSRRKSANEPFPFKHDVNRSKMYATAKRLNKEEVDLEEAQGEVDTDSYHTKNDPHGGTTLTHKKSKKSVYLQGDDAAKFRRDIHRASQKLKGNKVNRVLDQYDGVMEETEHLEEGGNAENKAKKNAYMDSQSRTFDIHGNKRREFGRQTNALRQFTRGVDIFKKSRALKRRERAGFKLSSNDKVVKPQHDTVNSFVAASRGYKSEGFDPNESLQEGSALNFRSMSDAGLQQLATTVFKKRRAGGRPTPDDQKIASRAKAELRRRRNVKVESYDVSLASALTHFGIASVAEIPDEHTVEFFQYVDSLEQGNQ